MDRVRENGVPHGRRFDEGVRRGRFEFGIGLPAEPRRRRIRQSRGRPNGRECEEWGDGGEKTHSVRRIQGRALCKAVLNIHLSF